MKRHVQKIGVRYWAGDDLIELQSEPLEVVESFFSQFGNMIISGCEVNGNTLNKGLVALNGFDPDNNSVFKVAPVEAAKGLTFPVYLTLKCEVIEREYGDGNIKPVKEIYTAKLSSVAPNPNISYLTIYENNSYNKRFADNISPGSRKITLKNVQSKNYENWTNESDMPLAAYGAASAVVDGLIYIIGGTAGSDVLDQNLCYNPVTKKWTVKAAMPTKRRYFTAATIGGKIYVIGGIGQGGGLLSTMLCYDPNTDGWSVKADIPTARSYLSSSVISDKIYVIGGSGAGGAVNANECYDPNTDSWSVKADMLNARRYHTSSAINGKIYVIGGNVGSVTSSANECYDPNTDVWSVKADMPTARYYLASSTANGKIYVMGGNRGSSVASNANECYDPNTDVWSVKADVPTARYFLTLSVVDGEIYVIGGYNKEGIIVKTECYYDFYTKKIEVLGSSRMVFNKNVLWNNEFKPANIPFNTINPGVLTFPETDVSGEIEESLDITYNSL